MTSWEKINAGNGNNWIDWSDAPDGLFQPMTSAEKEMSGCDNGIVCKYDPDNDADAWAISPAVALKSGEEYTIGIFVRDEGFYTFLEYSEENWKLVISTGATVADMLAGTVLIDQPAFNNQALKQYSVNFTPDADGEYHFGLQCYSEADNYGIYATGFSVSKQNSASVIATIGESCTPTRYFNLQGIEVKNPRPGNVYIIRDGLETRKVIIK